MKFYPVVMAGGSGTRFWPLSRARHPKQFLPLVSAKPLLLETVARLKGLATPAHTYVVCGPSHAALARRLLPALPPRNVLVEPVARNTAPAIALATWVIGAAEPEAVLAVLPSDHHVADPVGFRAVLRRAAQVARSGQLVTVGIQPTRPETGYGYIRLGTALGEGAFHVQAFVEKPDPVTAAEYVNSKEYLWNGGIFVFTARAMREAFTRHLPEVAAAMERLAPRIGRRGFSAALAAAFPRLPSVSLDYGLMEKARNIAVVPGDFGWSDVGSFAAIADVRPLDANGNVVVGEQTLVLDSAGCVVLGSGRTLAVLGMRDTVVVDAGDAVLVVPRERSQDVRQVVEALRLKRLTRAL
ncbi:MAG: mannose-1-phosphate guanylyltransferase [Myxococcaceae bacterium]